MRTTRKPKKDLNSVILCISDMHQPFSHPDLVPFLAAIKSKYEPTRVIVMGDEIDHHALSYHESDPDLHSAGDELGMAIKGLKPVYNLFPKAEVLESNHGSLVYRKAKTHGISRHYLKGYREVLQAPDGWTWHPDILIEVGDRPIYFHHGLAPKVARAMLAKEVSLVQGHFHTKLEFNWVKDRKIDVWGMTTGCLINSASEAFAYAKHHLTPPEIGCGIILDGRPMTLHMPLDKKRRWTRVVP